MECASDFSLLGNPEEDAEDFLSGNSHVQLEEACKEATAKQASSPRSKLLPGIRFELGCVLRSALKKIVLPVLLGSCKLLQGQRLSKPATHASEVRYILERAAHG